MSAVADQTVQAVATEIGVTLGEARAALEAYADAMADPALLGVTATRLHDVFGVLRVIEVHGAALLAEEMECVARFLANASAEQRNQPEGLDALMRSMVQLPAYLERVLAGGRDVPLVLLPLLNDLRAVRGQALLSEGTLLLLNLKSDRQPEAPHTASDQSVSVTQVARRLRPRFQLALLGLLKGERLPQHLDVLAQIAERIEKSATRQPVFQLWWVVGAVVEALSGGGADGAASLKRLLGQADRELRRLYEVGEARYADAPPLDLLNNLLYFIARTPASGQRISAVRQSFRLHELLPVSAEVESERESLAAPSIKLMETVGSAIREDLTRVKDALDVFVRTGGIRLADLTGQLELLRKIGDTLGVLGLSELRGRVIEQWTVLTRWSRDGALPTNDVLVDVAAELIAVEDSLESQLVGLIRPKEAVASNPSEEADAEFLQVQAAVLRECIVNLAHIKEAVGASIAGRDVAQSDQVPALLRGIKAGLLMLGRGRAIEVLDRIGRHMSGGLASALDGSSTRLDRLADAIVSIEYYMETLQAGRSEPVYMLENAEACLRVLEASGGVAGLPPAPSSAVPLLTETATMAAEPAAVAVSAPAQLSADAASESGVYLAAPPPVIAVSDAAMAGPAVAEDIDPDLIQLFIEEAREELEKIQVNLPAWDRNPLDDDALTRLRRSFHTLKGSGRMVGARLVGDYSWAIEHLLNRIISGTRNRTPALLALLRDAVYGLPLLIDQLETRESVAFDVTGMMLRLHSFAEGQESEASDEGDAQDLDTTPRTGGDTATVQVHPSEPLSASWMIDTSVLLVGQDSPLVQTTESGANRSTLEVPDRFVQVEDPAVEAEADAAEENPPVLLTAAHTQAVTADDADPTLAEIYSTEVANHVAAIRAWVGARSSRPGPHLVSESLHRACHTLAGASRMAGIREGTDLAEPLLHGIRRHFDQGLSLPAGAVELLGQVADVFERIAAGERGTADLINHLSGLKEHLAAWELPVAAEESTPPVPDTSISGAYAAIEFDPDIAAIFSEEASELLESASEMLDRLQRRPTDDEAVTALKRYLHTLKGGARMAGVPAMGEVAHELESLLGHYELGGSSAPAVWVQSMQAGFDVLESMRDTVRSGRPADRNEELIAQLRVTMGTRLVPPTLRDFAPEQPEPQPIPTVDPPLALSVPVITEVAQAVLSPVTPIEPEALATETLAASAPQEIVESEALERVSSATVADLSANRAAPRLADAPLVEASSDSVSVRDLEPFSVRPESTPKEERQELARVDADLLDALLNGAGEVSIQRARLEQHLTGIDSNLSELSRVVSRLRDQLRKLEIETEAQVLHRYEDERRKDDFDPLEMDRYSTLQQYSRALAESASDVASLQGIIETQVRESQNLLMQQARVVTDLQNGLMRTRMVPFQRHVPRLSRLVRQVAQETGKKAALVVSGSTGELDRQVLERMLAPFEHMLRNAIVHGIEMPEQRQSLGKSEEGRVEVALRREGSEVIFVVQDDGAGLDLAAIRDHAISTGLLNDRQIMSDSDMMQLILEPGFSTAAVVTQSAGRGVGMDVVTNEVKRLGGSLQIDSTPGQGTRFTIRLPFTLAVSQALILRAGTEIYAVPLPTVESVIRLPRSVVQKHLADDAPSWTYGGQVYRFQHLGLFVGGRASELPVQDVPVPVILVRAGDSSTAIIADEMVGSREIVIKNVGPQIASIRGVAGATMLSDGRIVVILDLGALVRGDWRTRVQVVSDDDRGDHRTFALVVDDSITVRRVTQRLLERNGMRVMTARDGVDALAILQDHVPDILLLDIEMPRMDGYELAARVRADARLQHIPIVMITSRVGEKHRARAIEVGVDDYLGKPYQESQLLDAIEPLVRAGRVSS